MRSFSSGSAMEKRVSNWVIRCGVVSVAKVDMLERVRRRRVDLRWLVLKTDEIKGGGVYLFTCINPIPGTFLVG